MTDTTSSLIRRALEAGKMCCEALIQMGGATATELLEEELPLIEKAIRQHSEEWQSDWKQKYDDLLQSSKDFIKGAGKYDTTLETVLNQKQDILDRLIYIQHDPENCGWDVMLNLGTACVKGENAIIIKSFDREIHAKQFRAAIMGDASARKDEDTANQVGDRNGHGSPKSNIPSETLNDLSNHKWDTSEYVMLEARPCCKELAEFRKAVSSDISEKPTFEQLSKVYCMIESNFRHFECMLQNYMNVPMREVVEPLNDSELIKLARFLIILNPDKAVEFKKQHPEDWEKIKFIMEVDWPHTKDFDKFVTDGLSNKVYNTDSTDGGSNG